MSPRPRPLPAYLVLVAMLGGGCNTTPRDAERAPPAAVPAGVAGAASLVAQPDIAIPTADPNAATPTVARPIAKDAKGKDTKKAETADTWKLGNKVASDDWLDAK
ncbi:MAG TPA: hypothetical protein VG755_02470 [Nannocystaceae bacterium]|nr:hypothetical protein [Nannocystaceae bacterium]